MADHYEKALNLLNECLIFGVIELPGSFETIISPASNLSILFGYTQSSPGTQLCFTVSIRYRMSVCRSVMDMLFLDMESLSFKR